MYSVMTYQEYLRTSEGLKQLADEVCVSPEAARTFIKSLGGRASCASGKNVSQPTAGPSVPEVATKKKRR